MNTMLSRQARTVFALLMAASLLVFGGLSASAKEAAPAVEDPVLEAKMLRIAAELRCLVCQNQTIADSNADLAVDLRRQVREMLLRGDSERQIIDYMTARYGDFVLYRPPLRATTALLWFGPVALLLIGIGVLAVILRRRSRLSADQFEPDMDPYEPDADDPRAAPLPASRSPVAGSARHAEPGR